MDLPLHEQLRNETWRRMIDQAGLDDLESLRKISLAILDYAIANRAFAMAQARAFLPQQKAPAANATGAQSINADQNFSS